MECFSGIRLEFVMIVVDHRFCKVCGISIDDLPRTRETCCHSHAKTLGYQRAYGKRYKRKDEIPKSKYLCVTWHMERAQWRVQLRVDGRRHTVGFFDDELEAARAHDLEAKKYIVGPRLNFPKGIAS